MYLIKRYVYAYFKYIASFVVLISFIAGLEFLLPLYIRELFSSIEMNTIKNMNNILISYFVFFTILHMIKGMYYVIRLKFLKCFKTNESKYMYFKLFNMKYEYFSKCDPTYFSNRIKDSIGILSKMIGENLPKAAIAVVILCISLIIMYKVNIYIFMLFVLLVPLNYFCYKMLNKVLMKKSKEAQFIYAENAKNVVGVVQNIEHIKQSYRYNLFADLIGDYVLKAETKGNELNSIAQLVSLAIEFVISLVKNGILFLTIYFYFNKSMLFADIIFVNMILGIFSTYLSDLSSLNLSIRDVKIASDFIKNDILKQQEQTLGNEELIAIENISLDIDSFQYDNKVILRNVQFKLNKKEKIGIVGKSGCGKSTLGKLLIRLYDTDSISINGINIKDYSIESLRKKIYLITQSISLFPGTIKDNITIGIDNYDEDRLNKVLLLSFMKYFDSFENGIDTLVKEKGFNISGGEKQRISIARMLMSDPELIIFDESTSSLDCQTEREIFDNIKELCKDRAYIIISHRIDMIKECDNIIMMEDGKINAIGNYHLLKQTAEDFNRLFAGSNKEEEQITA